MYLYFCWLTITLVIIFTTTFPITIPSPIRTLILMYMNTKNIARNSDNSEFIDVEYKKHCREQRKQRIHEYEIQKAQPATAEAANFIDVEYKSLGSTNITPILHPFSRTTQHQNL